MSNFEGEKDDYASLLHAPSSAAQDERARARVRLRELAIEADVDTSNKTNRQAFIVQMYRDGLWFKGDSAAEMAEVWGISQSTVQNDSADAFRLIKLMTDQGEAARVFYENLTEQIDAAKETREFTRDKIKKASSIDAGPMMSSDIRNLADASNKAAAMADRPLELLGRVSGVLETEKTQVLVQNIMQSPEVQGRIKSFIDVMLASTTCDCAERCLAIMKEGE